MRGLTAGVLLAFAVVVPACSSASPAAAPATPSVTPSTRPSAPAAPEVNCGPAGAGQADVIAERTAAGLVDCAEAVAVITEYHAAEDGDEPVTVRDWTCGADADTEIVVCEKAGLSFHTGR